MAMDMFLKLKNIKGESVDKDHKGEIDVLSWSWGASQSGNTHIGSGSGAGKASFQDVQVVKWYDVASPDLMKLLSKGTHTGEGTLTVRKAGDVPLEYYILEMKDIIVTSLGTGASGGEDRLTETMTLNFREFKVKYTQQAATGGADTKADFAWDIAKNAEA